jgi:superfamily II DNA or RNA helicase
VDQWVERLAEFLDLPVKSIGRIGGGRKKPTGVVDVAVIQSLVRKDVVNDCVADFGQVIVDECHHLSAHSFEQVVCRAKARFVLGLSATVTRKDGHHPIIFMQASRVSSALSAVGGRRNAESSDLRGDRAGRTGRSIATRVD